MLKQRIITASILVAVFLCILLLAPLWLFSLAVATVVAFAAWEWANLAGVSAPAPRWAYAAVMVCGAGAFSYAVVVGAVGLEPVLLVSGVWWAIALLWVQSYPASAVLWRSTALRSLMGAFVLVPALVAFAVLRDMTNGHWLVAAVVVLVAAADIGAYFFGRKFGKRKLAPKVSPGKTWAGAVGGLFTVAVVATVFALLTQGPLWMTLAVALPAAMASIVGDLFESMLKRHRGIKDSSQLLPGHGGVLDRIDGLVAAAPIFALVVVGTGWQI